MQIFKTYNEVVAAIDTTAGVTAGYVALTRKADANTFHEGHESLISYCKANFDLTVVCLWDVYEFLNYLFPENSAWDANANLPWDSTGCIAWCEAKGVDILLLPDEGHTEQHFAGNDMEATVAFVQQKWVDEGYNIIETIDDNPSEFNNMQISQGMSIADYLFPNKPWVQVNTWKDGRMRFTVNDFCNKYCSPLQYHILDPVVCPSDGLYYSSAHYSYTEQEKALIAQIPVVVDATGYSDIQLLVDELNKIDSEGNLVIYRIELTEGGVVGAANDFLSIYYEMGEYVDNWPIYKKGVR